MALPVERIGKQRESLTVNSEEYKKQFLRYLLGRQYYTTVASSDVEATFADTVLVLTRKGERREYWLEVKATSVSLSDADFLQQLAKYIALYLSRSSERRFKLILGCYKLIDWELFNSVFEYSDKESIEELMAAILLNALPHDRVIIEKARAEDVKAFFEDTTIKEADLKSLDFAEAKVIPKAPARPSLAEAEYAESVINNFGDVSPIGDPEEIYLNLFSVELPPKIFTADGLYQSSDEMYSDPSTVFPPHDFREGKVVTFSEFNVENPLSYTINPYSIKSLDTTQYTREAKNQDTVKTILNRWIRGRCKAKELEFDKRTKTYYYHRHLSGSGIVTAKWKPKVKTSVRELTRPMKSSDGKINYWVHRGAEIFATVFAGQVYIQIRPRFLFSWDGVTLMEGSDAELKDRKFRKSNYNRNMNQLYDVRFWCRHLFPETEAISAGIMSLSGFIDTGYGQSIKVIEQIFVECECRPNEDKVVNVEDLDAIGQPFDQLADYIEW